jgi:hypothetical protein
VNAVINTASPGETAMKSALSILALALAVTASLTQAHAQTTHVSSVNVPFAFNQGTDHFAPGTYQIAVYDNNSIVLIDSNWHSSLLPTQSGLVSGAGTESGYVAFRKYGNTYFIAEYRSADGASLTLTESKKERSVARDYASNQTDTGSVQLALNSSR